MSPVFHSFPNTPLPFLPLTPPFFSFPPSSCLLLLNLPPTPHPHPSSFSHISPHFSPCLPMFLCSLILIPYPYFILLLSLFSFLLYSHLLSFLPCLSILFIHFFLTPFYFFESIIISFILPCSLFLLYILSLIFLSFFLFSSSLFLVSVFLVFLSSLPFPTLHSSSFLLVLYSLPTLIASPALPCRPFFPSNTVIYSSCKTGLVMVLGLL